jgi:hypothetical protein
LVIFLFDYFRQFWLRRDAVSISRRGFCFFEEKIKSNTGKIGMARSAQKYLPSA